jgi:hypothetical protein
VTPRSRGPIARLWATAQGGLVDVAGGNLDSAVTLRYGGRIGDDVAWRLYFRDTLSNDTLSNTRRCVWCGRREHKGYGTARPKGWAQTK